MKIERISIIAAMLVALLVPTVSASVEDEIAARIKKAGSVCVQGEDCGGAAAVEVAVATLGPAEHYANSCANCHEAGIAGAPKMGDVAAWEPRVAKGIDVLYESVYNGLAPGMPARGLCMSCSDEDLDAIVDYMLASVEE